MIIFPDIEIQEGRSVNRTRGKEKEPDIYDISPLQAARGFVDAGAEWLHLIDMDSSLQHGRINSDLICEIIQSVDVPVQVGGGIRTQSDVEWWLDRGAARVVLGTAAVVDRLLITEVCGRYPQKIVISVTGKDGYAMIDGWRTKTSFTTLELVKSFEDSGVAAIIYTDLDRFEGGQEVGLASTIEIGTEVEIPLISTGTVYSLDDVSALSLLPNIEGAIIGRVLFDGTMDLAEAINVARTSRISPELSRQGVAPKAEEVSGIPMKGIDHVDIAVTDPDRSTIFYETMGFVRQADQGSTREGYTVMSHHSGVSIHLVHQKVHAGVRPQVTIQVDSLQQARAFMEHNGHQLVDLPGLDHQHGVCIRDPDGNTIALTPAR